MLLPNWIDFVAFEVAPLNKHVSNVTNAQARLCEEKAVCFSGWDDCKCLIETKQGDPVFWLPYKYSSLKCWLVERCIFYVYTKDSRLEFAPINETFYGIRESLLSLLCKACFRNQHIKINVVVTQTQLIFYICNMELFQGGKFHEKIYAVCSGLGLK